MVDESFAAVTSRRVAEKAGVNAALVHYYFPTLDDLFIAVYRRRTEALVGRLEAALSDEQPLWAIWEFNTDRTATTLVSEFLALANHRRAIQAEIAGAAEHLRKLQIEAMANLLERHQIDRKLVDPASLVLLMVAIPRTMVIEETLGMTTGHDATRDDIERYLTEIEGPRQPPE